MLNLADKITLSRLALTPVIVVLLYFPGKLVCLLALLLFILASLTDLIDGMVARRLGLVSNFGKFLDPLADKVLVCSLLIMMVQLQWAPAWVVILIVIRELLVTGLRAVASDQGIVIAADKVGKWKAATQMVSICFLLLHYEWFGLSPVLPGLVLLYLALVLTVFSGVHYLRNFYRSWMMGEAGA